MPKVKPSHEVKGPSVVFIIVHPAVLGPFDTLTEGPASEIQPATLLNIAMFHGGYTKKGKR